MSRGGYSQGVLVGINFLLGCGLLTPWNSIITAVDFFSALFPHMDPADSFAVANFAGNLTFLVLQVAWVQSVSTLKASICFTLFLAVLGFSLWLSIAFPTPFSDSDKESMHFMALVGGLAVVGAAAAGLQPALYSIAGEMGPTGVTSFMNGQAFAGILTCVCRILSKVWFAHHPAFEALRLSSALYLSSSLAVVCFAFCGFFAIQRARDTGGSGYGEGESKEDPANRIEAESLIGGHDDEEGGSPRSAPELENFAATAPSGRTVFARMWGCAVGVGFTFWVTLALFPGVTCRIRAAQSDPEEWMAVVLITVFNVGDLLGRMLAGATATSLSESSLWVLNVVRIGFVPLLVYLQGGGDTAGGSWSHDAAALLSVLAMALTSGFLACAFIMKGQLRVASSADRDEASTLLALAMTLGLALGAVSALPLRKLVL